MRPGTLPVIGKIGQALSFDGVDSHVDAGAGSSLNITSSLTLSAWVKTPSISTQQAIASRGYLGARRYQFDITSSKARFAVADGDAINAPDILSGSTILSGNTFYHLVGVFDGSKMMVYVNGILDGTATKTTKPNSSTAEKLHIDVSLNNNAGDFYRFFNGSLDEVRIYNRALSGDEVKRLYNMGR
ncbi:MAG: LamG domain-containing protein [bacterium]|nr:LamG domain-containing protein [bacterium]